MSQIVCDSCGETLHNPHDRHPLVVLVAHARPRTGRRTHGYAWREAWRHDQIECRGPR